MKKHLIRIAVFLATFPFGVPTQHFGERNEPSVPAASSTTVEINKPAVKNNSPVPDHRVLIPWQASIDRTQYDWNGKDLLVERAGKRVRLFSKAAREEAAFLQREGGRCFISNYFTPLAVIGDIVSYNHETGISCGTEAGDWSYTSVNVRAPSEYLSLDDFFSGDQILHAFIANSKIDREIQKALTAKRIDKAPSSLKELSSFLTKRDYAIFDGFLVFQEGFLTAFAFHHLQGEQVSVWVSLSSTSTVGRAQREHVEIFLPIPEKLSDSLRKADLGEQGFLMKDHAFEVGTVPAVFESQF